MEHIKYLIIGAGVSGLAFANAIHSQDYLILERDSEIGGYCKTIHQDGFTWDYSGHFFHFKHPEIERFLVERMDDEIRVVHKSSKIYYKNNLIEFPFQKNIHQLPQDEFIECLYHLFFRDEKKPSNFKEMVYSRFGKGIAEKFLIPYNEKLYACDLGELDVDAMGRFFPYADLQGIIRNFLEPDNHSYNATFTYPKGGAIQYIHALMRDLKPDAVALNEPLIGLDLKKNIAKTPKREISFDYLISSAPFDKLLSLGGFAQEAAPLRSNKVLIFNLGFDRKGAEDLHWLYFPQRDISFYRVGFYDNIFSTERMSLYVEIGAPSHAVLDTEAALQQTLLDLKKAGIVSEHQLVSHHTVTLDPAYVHITMESNKLVEHYRKRLAARGVYSIGRYGGWTYCSIEDNILEAREIASVLNTYER